MTPRPLSCSAYRCTTCSSPQFGNSVAGFTRPFSAVVSQVPADSMDPMLFIAVRLTDWERGKAALNGSARWGSIVKFVGSLCRLGLMMSFLSFKSLFSIALS